MAQGMEKNWQILHPDTDAVDRLTQGLKCHPVTAAVLVNRDILTATQARKFLAGSLNNLPAPFAIKDMDAAVHRIADAIAGNEKILLFGDYDVDGITATVILLNFLRHAGADVSYYIPHRIAEGYSIQPRHISRYAAPNSIDLIITADCGSGSHRAVEAANRAGIDIIITDHHSIAENLPPALAVVNPRRHDCPAGLGNLAGVGVAFFLLICLRKHLRDNGFWQERPEPNLKNYCDLVALGTIADMVPLIEENRVLCKTGLQLLAADRRPGLAALMKASAVDSNFADAEDIAFRLAPRLNAAGRMDHAARAVELLSSNDADAAAKSAQTLNLLNQRRQQLEKKTLADIERTFEINPSLLRRHSLVLADSQWHAGLIGIVATRIVEKFHRPTVLIATGNDLGTGSARSVPALNLYEALAACSSYLESFGGHAMAAGLKIHEKNIDAFQQQFENVVQQTCRPEDFTLRLRIDRDLDFDVISTDLINELETLTPFGVGNPEPLFRAGNVTVVSSQIVGHHHRRMMLRQSWAPNAPVLSAIHFNVEDTALRKKDFAHIVFKLRCNRWNNRKTAQIVVADWQ
jgi:single-stranded-DNA-specific exonuclease